MRKDRMSLTNWINLPKEEDIESLAGFVYLITNLESGKKYIGRKYFWKNLRIKRSGKKNKKKVTKESDWRFYKSSSKYLLKDIEELGEDKFLFEILNCYKTRQEVNFAEVREQFVRDVLKTNSDGSSSYYNENILSRYFKPKPPGTPEYKRKSENIAKGVKGYYDKNPGCHPLLGKVHPNRGKKMPQTAHHKNKGIIRLTDGKSNITIRKGGSIPEGFRNGLTTKGNRKNRAKEEYPSHPKKCIVCDKELSYEGRYNKTCSPTCRIKITREKSKERNKHLPNPMSMYEYITPKEVSRSLMYLADLYGVTTTTICNWAKSGKNGFSRRKFTEE